MIMFCDHFVRPFIKRSNSLLTTSRSIKYTINPRKPTADQPQRTGVVAMKCGMVRGFFYRASNTRSYLWCLKVVLCCVQIPSFDHWGVRRVLTVLKLEDCQVVQVKTKAKEGFDALQIGSGLAKAKRTKLAQRSHFEKAGVPIKRHLAEFRVSEDALCEQL